MQELENIGNWTAEIKNDGKAPAIEVNGSEIPTDGTKPLFELRRKEPQGFSDSELVLDFIFGEHVEPSGQDFIKVHYNEIIQRDPFKTVLIVDGNQRKIANIEVKSAQNA